MIYDIPVALKNLDKPIPRHPPWLKQRLPVDRTEETWLRGQLKEGGLHTVCQEARCPNLHECFSQRTATFLLMGSVCTRACTFCAIQKGRPMPLDPQEPERLAALTGRMGLRYVVLTSVNRDDLPDGGAGHFVATIRALRQQAPGIGVEVLTPDFRGNLDNVDTVASEKPAVFNHNVETVPRLYGRVRPGSVYERSLSVLGHVARQHTDVPVKSGLMVGLGETPEEVHQVMVDLREVGVRLLVIGQYLSPANQRLSEQAFVPPEVFEKWREQALSLVFEKAHVSPFARSSHHAAELAGVTPP